MRTTDIIRRAGRSLKNAKARTILTSLAIAVGAFTLTLALAAGAGARSYTNTLLTSNIDPQVLAIAADSSVFKAGESGPQEYNPSTTIGTRANGVTIKLLNQSDIDKIAARSDIASITPTYTIDAQYVTQGGAQKKYTAEVTTYDSGVTQTVAAGALPALRSSITDSQIALPEVYVPLLGFTSDQDAVGKTVTIHLSRTPNITEAQIEQVLATQGTAGLQALSAPSVMDATYTIVAVVGKSATALSAATSLEISNNSAKSLSDFSTLGTSSYQKYSLATASVKTGIDPETVKNALTKQGYGVETAKDLQSLLFTIVDTLQGVVIGFGLLAIVTSVFGIINTQYISVLERTREIGLMKALGMRGRHVSRLFQFEAAWIGFLGGVLGSLLAVILGLVLNPWITSALSLGAGTNLLIFQPVPILLLIIVLMLIAMLAGYFPARKASKLDPIEALRTE
jgi:putative ABC transport system permease protein